MSLVEIKPSPDGDGFLLVYEEECPVWFEREHHAVAHARELHPECEVLVYADGAVLKHRIPAAAPK